MAIWWRRASRGGGARAAADRQCPAAGSTGEWGRSEARATSGSCCSIPPDALVKTACVGRYNAMASTMGEDPNAFSGCLVWHAAVQQLAEVRDENSIRTHRGENTGRTFPLPVRQLPWAPR